MWTYSQTSGELSENGQIIGRGYAGGNIPPHHDPSAVNNPARQSEHNTGPLPQGLYTVGPAQDNAALGPMAMPLTPCPGNLMFGRSGFWMHADSLTHPGEASEGCIVMPHEVRFLVSISNDRELLVTP
jgi:hypothetical protein